MPQFWFFVKEFRKCFWRARWGRFSYRAGPLSQGGPAMFTAATGCRSSWTASTITKASRRLPGARRVYGAARPELAAWCADQKLPLETFPWARQ
jgi:hypothetical protein